MDRRRSTSADVDRLTVVPSHLDVGQETAPHGRADGQHRAGAVLAVAHPDHVLGQRDLDAVPAVITAAGALAPHGAGQPVHWISPMILTIIFLDSPSSRARPSRLDQISRYAVTSSGLSR